MHVIDHDTIKKYPSLANAGCSIKKPSLGKEYTAVLEYIEKGFPDEKGCELCVFIEPNIGYSYPDIVLVYIEKKIFKKWKSKRKELNKNHLRFMSDLHAKRVMKLTDIDRDNKRRWHLSWFKTKKALYDAIETLSRLGILTRSENYIRINDDHFATKKIIAIEAKRRKWKKGLQQSIFHTSYASESYLWMIDGVYKRQELFEQAGLNKVGILLEREKHDSPTLEAKRLNIPCGRPSWYLDHWAWIVCSEKKK